MFVSRVETAEQVRRSLEAARFVYDGAPEQVVEHLGSWHGQFEDAAG